MLRVPDHIFNAFNAEITKMRESIEDPLTKELPTKAEIIWLQSSIRDQVEAYADDRKLLKSVTVLSQILDARLNNALKFVQSRVN